MPMPASRPWPRLPPQAFQALRDPALSAGHRFLARTPVTERMVEVGSGYFLYDIAICLSKFGGVLPAGLGWAGRSVALWLC